MIKYFKVLFYFLCFPLLLHAQNAPVANNDSYTIFVNTTLNERAPGILINDTDEDGDSLTVTEFLFNSNTYTAGSSVNFAQGTITILADGSLTFVPTTDYVGSIPEISYNISDGTFTGTATLNINIIYPPTAPEANNDDRTIFINTTLNEPSPGLLSNDTDLNNDILTISSFSINNNSFNTDETANFSEGSITIAADGSFLFLPNNGFVGTVSPINYVVSDGALSDTATLNVNVIYPPTPPEVMDDYDTADINTTLSVSAPGVIANDSDINGDALNITTFSITGTTYNAGQIVALPQGSFTLNADGSYTLVPTPNFTGELPTINYIITDGRFTVNANLFISVEPTEDLLQLNFYESCNQGFTANGEYKIRYTAVYTNRSNAKDYHEPSLIRNIDITNDLQESFGSGCVIEVDEINVYNDTFTRDYINGGGMPREFNNDALNNNFANVTSNSIFNTNAINNLVLYPRQNFTLVFCVTVDPFCNGRPNPTPSGSGIDFTNTINATSNRGNATATETLTDFHTTEAVVTAGLFVPEFNDALDPPGTINPNGTYDYSNRVIITNEGSSTANNINFNMGLGSFLDNGIVFDEVRITQVSGPPVTINNSYDGNTETNLLTPNNSLVAGEKVILELFYLIQPYNSNTYSFFYQIPLSQTQGALDGFDESTAASRRENSFITWSDGLGNHVDRYYRTEDPENSVSSDLQCDCRRSSMRFLYTSSSEVSSTISNINTVPNGVLEHEEITLQITITNTSESVELNNLQIENNLSAICGGNIVSLSTPIIESSTAQTNPNLNPNFDGVTDFNLFDGTSGVLGANEIVTVEFTLVLSETCQGTNSVTFTASDPLRNITSNTSTIIDASTDSDLDGIINSIDLDDDNDTIPDLEESNGLNPLDDDDADLLPNYRDPDFGIDANADGIVDIFDFDNDGVPNHLDLDSDNDGILDIVESGNASVDSNINGRTNNAIGANGLDNTLENNDSNLAVINYILPNSDTDSNLNYLDIDSDNDGIVDNIEAQLTNNFINANNTYTDEGIDTAYNSGFSPIDTDSDGIFDYIDTNSDNDIRDDIIEGWDIDADGTAETTILNSDLDNDGLDDAFDNNDSIINPTNNQTPESFPNADNADTLERDWRELIAIIVLIDNTSETEGTALEFEIRLVTKNDNSIPVVSNTPIAISFTTANGTSTTTIYEIATSPFDYTGVASVNHTIPALTQTSSFNITSFDDIIFENDELLTLTGTITSNNTINSEIVAIGTILDNDSPPSITMTDSRADEGTALQHTITISHPSSTPIQVQINTSDNIATAPLDYTAFSDVLTIDGTVNKNNANTQVTFNITTLLDNLNELDEETINVDGTVVSTGNTSAQDLNRIGTIVDIDPNPLIDISDVSVEEGEPLTFTIRLLNANNELMQNYLPINIVLETIDNTTTANQDYNAFSILTEIPEFTSTLTRTVTSIDDRLNEPTETFNLQITVNLANVSNTTLPIGLGTLKDNDYPNLFSPNNDGRSDTFKISGIVDDYPNFRLEIFNRQGNKVYSYSNNGNTNPIWWNGNYNGKPAPVGVYYYILDYNDGTRKPKTAFVQLVR